MVRQAGTRLFIAAATWTALLGTLFLVILWTCGPTVRGALLVAVSAVLILPLALLNLRGELDLFEPLVTANVAMAVMFVGRPLRDLITRQTVHLDYDVLPTVNVALLVA